ncbi:MAG: hypothetical protein IT342_20450 [Candidatus Melainabacteria bacterium]|jgi:hypothetical protein|nr:hypothetical protein [Candidatus Melainabacteria bacterium]
MATRTEHIEAGLGESQSKQQAIEFTLTKEDIDRIKHTPTSQLRDFGFSSADDLLDSVSLRQISAEKYLAKINPIKPILPGGKGGDKHPGGDSPGNPGGDWLPDPEDILDLSDEAKEALKTALAVAFVIGVVGICVSNPALLPAAARAISVLGPALAPRAMHFAR